MKSIMETDCIRLKEIKPELSDYISKATALLNDQAFPDDDSIHDIRVLLKKARASLKLIEPQFGSEYNHMDIPDLKEAADILAGWREAAVYRKILKDMKGEFPDLFARLIDNEKVTRLLIKQDQSGSAKEQIPDTDKVRALLKKAGYRIRLTGMKDTDPQKLLKELEKSYSIVVGSFVSARYKTSMKKLHTLRKKTKDLLYQLYFFRPLNSSAIKQLGKELENIAKNLGRIHDLEQLVKALEYQYPEGSLDNDMSELMVRIREKQDRYLKKVWPAASELFMPGMKLEYVLGYKVLVY
jgi:CHAD domain-containing protein